MENPDLDFIYYWLLYPYFGKQCRPHGVGEGTLVFSYIRRLGSFLGVQHFDSQFFFWFSEKYFFFFGGGGYHKFGLY